MNFLKTHKYIITLVWLGMVLGISFLEAPLKFQSELVDQKIGVSIGRIVFTALNRIELFFLILFTILSFLDASFKRNYLLHGLLGIMIIQTFLLLPFLDDRALHIMHDEPVEDSLLHGNYILLEVLKVIVLLWMSIYLIAKLNKKRAEL